MKRLGEIWEQIGGNTGFIGWDSEPGIELQTFIRDAYPDVWSVLHSEYFIDAEYQSIVYFGQSPGMLFKAYPELTEVLPRRVV